MTNHSSITDHSSRNIFMASLMPSWLSGLCSVVAGISLVVATMISIHYGGSSLQQLLDPGTRAGSVTNAYSSADSGITNNSYVSDIPLAIFWAAVGFLVYSFASSLVTALRNAAELGAELDYVHVDRHELLKAAGTRLAVRALVLAIWLVFLELSLHVFVPYAVALVRVSTGDIAVYVGVAYDLAAIILITLCVHLHTILFRLLVLRPRVFGGYIS